MKSTSHPAPTTAAPTPTPTTVLAIDLGKTSCRAAIITNGHTVEATTQPGAPGLAEHNGLDLSRNAILRALEHLDAHLLGTATSVGIGAAGVESERGAARKLARAIRDLLDVPVALVNDALSAHAGAFAGGDGKFLIVGTGAVLYSVTDRGVRQVDGWGPWLGDEGSGRWIGQMGLLSALRSIDNRGPHTTLAVAARRLTDSPVSLPTWVSQAGTPARQLASFAPTVLEHSADGDAEARRIVEEAATRLTHTCTSVDPEQTTVCVAGGVADNTHFRAILAASLSAHGYSLTQPQRGSLDGAALIAGQTVVRYEERIIRA